MACPTTTAQAMKTDGAGDAFWDRFLEENCCEAIIREDHQILTLGGKNDNNWTFFLPTKFKGGKKKV